MRDIPIFTSEYGAAGLVLKEIPYQQTAYITIHASEDPEKLIEECVSFCRACGAERIYASGHEALDVFPFHTSVIRMRCGRDSIPQNDVCVFPVQEHTVSQWQKLYNEKIPHVPNGAWMTGAEARKLAGSGEGYFVHRDGVLLGIGKVSGETIDFLAAVQPGAGGDVLCALSHILPGENVELTVASANQKAVKLYERFGFIPVNEISRWYQVF